MNQVPYYRYWGKALKDEGAGEPYHLLPYHCLDVAAVGKILLQSHQPLRSGLIKLTGLDEANLIRWAIFMLALHDIGKFAVSFQQLKPDLLATLQRRQSRQPYTERHDYLGYSFWQKRLKNHLQEIGVLEQKRQRRGLQSVDYWVSAVTGHHGQPPKKQNAGFLFDDHFESADQKAALDFVGDLNTLTIGDNYTFPNISADRAKESSWWLAGFSVLCDWLGSNADYFPFHSAPMNLDDYWKITNVAPCFSPSLPST